MSLPFSVFQLRSWMLRLTSWILSPWLKFPRLSSEDTRQIEELQQKGLVIYVVRSASILDAVFLQVLLRKQRLRSITWTNADALWTRRTPAGSSIDPQSSGMLFLRPGGGIVTGRLLKLEAKLESLVEWCRHDENQIYICPVVSVWQKKPLSIDSNIFDIIFGRMDRPGVIRRLYWLVRSAREITVRVAPEINLRELAHAKEKDGQSARQVARIVRLGVGRHFAAEEQAVIGPRIKRPELVLRNVVKHPNVQATIEEMVQSTGMAQDVLEETAYKCAREVSATYDIRAIRFLEWILSRAWSLLFSGFHVDIEGLNRVKDLMRKGPVLVVPSHKSHIDYLFISYVFLANDLPPPHIAAGINLSFWPVGPIFRRAGAFFLRRTFAGDRIYKVVFQTYLQLLLRDGFNIEFFIEGTRSRSGRIMPPRFGMLQMLSEAYDPAVTPNLSIQPVSIDYEMLVEQKSIEQELLGAEKQKENFAAVLGLRKKLGKSYGRVFLRFGDPIDFTKYRNENYEEGEDKAFVEKLGYAITDQVASSGTTTYSSILATALCIHHKRGLERESLDRKVDFLCTLLRGKGALLADTFPYTNASIDESLALFLRTQMLEEVEVHGKSIYMIPDNRRLILDYYKNNLLHYLAPLSVAAWSFRAVNPDENGYYRTEDLVSRYEFLWEMIRSFFNRRYDTIDELELREELQVFAHWDWISVDDNGIKILDRKPLMALENLLVNYYESQYVVALTMIDEKDQVRTKSAWLSSAVEMANVLYAKGDIWRFESRSKANIDGNLQESIKRGILQPVGETDKRKRDQQKYRIDPEGEALLREIFDTLHALIIDRKYLSSSPQS